MDFAYSPRVKELQEQLLDFMDSHVYPAEPVYEEQMAASGDPHHHPQVLEDLKSEAHSRGLWNLFLPHGEYGAGLTNLEYAPLAEIMGRSPLASEATNCSAPDTGNMEILALWGTNEQKQRWLEPLLSGTIRSAYSMTEPDVASSDASNIATRITREGDEYVIRGRKWWTSGAAQDRCELLLVMGVTDPEGGRHQRHSVVLVPRDHPGVIIERTLPVFGHDHGPGHVEVRYDDVRVPVTNLLGQEGDGFAIAQSRLGPGRIHHGMRSIGMAERAFELMCRRAHERTTFGRSLADHGVVQDWIAEARMAIEQTRLLVLKTAWLMDTVGTKGAMVEISATKVAACRLAVSVVDRAIQTFGARGVSDDTPLARMYHLARSLTIADGPDEVHKMVIARRELRRFAPDAA
jgi:acyl-CoA dehydrogenase